LLDAGCWRDVLRSQSGLIKVNQTSLCDV